jgi:hypothetical protein
MTAPLVLKLQITYEKYTTFSWRVFSRSRKTLSALRRQTHRLLLPEMWAEVLLAMPSPVRRARLPAVCATEAAGRFELRRLDPYAAAKQEAAADPRATNAVRQRR